MAASGARSFLRSSSFHRAASAVRVSCSEARASRPRQYIPNSCSASPRIRRSPAALSFCIESLLPLHNATAAALMTSMLSVSMKGHGWLSEGIRSFYCCFSLKIFQWLL
ncbi:hypothetical protein KSP39_PZI012365 [Platanthera zijinensis]|uniref:Protein NUCLEAR FUSION DEFECTIVE 6, chloroplastic/mitochondrial n=1 Tax=Platanthera zijinensis TaxID=2320716 RepID=A0AAP0BE35_9ASPA